MNWSSQESERIPVKEHNPKKFALLPGKCIIKRDMGPKKVGKIHLAPSSMKPALKGKLISTGPLHKWHEKVPVGSMVHIHGHAMIDMRLKWKDEIYDILLHDDIVGFEVAA